MKAINKYPIILICLFCVSKLSIAQTINWKKSPEQKSFLNAYTGWDYGVVYGVGYGYISQACPKQVALLLDFSIPSGNKLLDDFKWKAGAQLSILNCKDFHFIGKLNTTFRNYKSDMVTASNVGIEPGIVLGYFRSSCFFSAELSYDKGLTTRLKHSTLYKENYPGVVDGWYAFPGGNIYYGLQAGFSAKRFDIYLKGGKIIAENFTDKPLIPYYAMIGLNYHLKIKEKEDSK